MADAVSRALDNDSVLLCEAGTGIGKTLAYLVPAILSGRRVVISTATRALQDQITARDVPAIGAALGRMPDVAIAKGLSNYVCLRRLREARLSTDASPARKILPVVQAWVERTNTGDIAEVGGIAEDDPVWADVTSSSDTRVGSSCAHHDECFVTRMRRELQRAQIIVVNHHLFFADLALRTKAGPAAEARAGVLPPYDAVVFDEAHRIEDVASMFFGVRVSTAKIAALLRDAARAFGTSLGERDAIESLRVLEVARAASAAFFGSLRKLADRGGGGEGRIALGPDALDADQRRAHRDLDDALDIVESFAETHAVSDAVEVVRRRARGVRDDAFAAVEPATHHVAWMETRRDHVSLGASLVDVGPVFRDLVVGRTGGVVLTSATLSTVPFSERSAPASAPAPVSGFSFLKRRLGLDEGLQVGLEEVELGSPFDYDSRALLYVPRDLPDTAHASFLDRAAQRAAELVAITGGGAFMLTTSMRAMRHLGASLARTTGLPVFVQGEAPKAILLERFRAHGNAVLVATLSYWEGVDVPGDALRLVMFDKLPFAVPSDALVAARCSALAEAGLDPFTSYTVPEAAITLKQGVGRLMRTRSDRGIAAVFDHRIVTRGYGYAILERLPIAQRTEEIEDVRAFWERMRTEG
ncbi:MAG: ATP-dependent DNA helicase [Polyangiaceae bacterium]|nr:ATP-dependent DNA helicase [Polyangiaceae bacterium]